MRIFDRPVPPDPKPTALIETVPSKTQNKPNRIMFILDLSIRKAEIHNPQIAGVRFNGSVQFGLQRGKLKVALENGTMPRTDSKLGRPPLLANREVEQQEERSLEASSTDLQLKGGLRTVKRTKEAIPQILCSGSEAAPYWEFKKVGMKINDPSNAVLEGDIDKSELGQLYINERPCSASFTFEIQQKDILFIDTSIFWLKGIHGTPNPNSYKGLRVRLYKDYVETKINPCVSCAEVTYDQ